MTTAVDEALNKLRARWPSWQVWIVHTFDGSKPGIVWCARPLGKTRPVLNAYEWQHLDEYLQEITDAVNP